MRQSSTNFTPILQFTGEYHPFNGILSKSSKKNFDPTKFGTTIKRKNTAHKLEAQYYLISSSDNIHHIYPPDDLIESDALYYEMCTGVSLTAEITASLLSFQKSFEVTCNGFSPRQMKIIWDGNIKDFWIFFLELLKDHASFLTNCPFVFWRSTMIREVMGMVYQKFLFLPILHIMLIPDAILTPIKEDDIRAYFREALCLKASQINIEMLSASRFSQHINCPDNALLQQLKWDCQQVLEIEKALSDTLFSEVDPNILPDDLRTMLRYDAIGYQNSGYSPEATQTYKLLYEKISQHEPITPIDTNDDIYAAIKASFCHEHGTHHPTWALYRMGSQMANYHVTVPYHSDITWRIIKRRIDDKEKEWDGEVASVHSPIDSTQTARVPPYIRDELAKIRADYSSLLNSPTLNRGNGIFRYCDTSHENMQRIISAAEEIKKQLSAQEYAKKEKDGESHLRKRTIVHTVFAQVHETLYPNGYIEFTL